MSHRSSDRRRKRKKSKWKIEQNEPHTYENTIDVFFFFSYKMAVHECFAREHENSTFSFSFSRAKFNDWFARMVHNSSICKMHLKTKKRKPQYSFLNPNILLSRSFVMSPYITLHLRKILLRNWTVKPTVSFH